MRSPLSKTSQGAPAHRRFDLYHLALGICVLVYTLHFSGLAFALHAGMRTHKADLGQIDQAIWNSSRGRFLEQTDNGYVATRMTDHVEPLLVAISPVLWLWDDVRSLLLLQVAAVASGAFFVYALALNGCDRALSPRERGQVWLLEPQRQLTRPLALTLALAYLLAPQLQSALLTEFHAAPLAAPLILWALWAVETGRWRHFLAAGLLVAAVKEEMALLAATLAVWALWRTWLSGHEGSPARQESGSTGLRTGYWPGLVSGGVLLLLALTWFGLTTFVIVPHFAAGVYGVAESGYFARYGALGDSPVDIVKSFFTQPQLVWQILGEPARRGYLLELVTPFGLLALLAPEVLLLSLPVLLANVLSAYPAQYYGEFHYSAPLMPFVAAAAALGMARLWRWGMRRTDRSSANFQHMPAAGAAVMALVAFVRNGRTALRPLLSVGLVVWVLAWASMAYVERGRGWLGGRYDPTPITAHHRLLAHFVEQIPPDAALTATAAVHPHVSHRRYVYQFPLGLDAPTPAEWALLDVTTSTDMAPGDLKRQVDAMLAGAWGVVDAADGFLLLQRGAAPKAIPASFYDFTASMGEDTAQWGETTISPFTIRLLPPLDWPRWRQSALQFEVALDQAGQPPLQAPPLQAPPLQVVTPAGEVLYTLNDVTPPALVWRPVETWRAGDRVRITTLPLSLPRLFSVIAGDEAGAGAVLGLFQRNGEGHLVQAEPPSQPAATAAGGAQDAAGVQLSVTASLATVDIYQGAAIELWLIWHGEGWPADQTVFVHLRRDGVNMAQADGAPRLFLPGNDAAQLATERGLLDLRQLVVPADAPMDGMWEVVLGLYHSQTGQRLPMVASATQAVGDELVIATLHPVDAPVPDQACALIPATCASQPVAQTDGTTDYTGD